jgi:uncharacterized protein
MTDSTAFPVSPFPSTLSIPLSLGLLLVLSGITSPSAAQEQQRFAGLWGGAIQLPTGALEVQVTLTPLDGGWQGTIDIPAQGARGLALAGVRAWGDSITFAIAGVPGDPTFAGELREERITGTFQQGGQGFPFHLARDPEPVSGPHRPQTPTPPFPYHVEEVAYQNGDVTLAGTLTLPRGEGPFPAVVMITGSGPQDRDETIFDHRPFAVLANHLTRGGIAVLRADDRGVGGSTGSTATATSRDFAADALAGLRWLQARPEIARDRIGLLGHSEGGMVAAMAAADDPNVAFIVMMAGTGVPLSEVMVAQARLLSLAGGADPVQVERQGEAQRELFRLVAAGADIPVLREQMRKLIEVQVQIAQPGHQLGEEAMEQLVNQHLQGTLSPWFRFALTFDPREALRQVKVPVLALNGSLDLQVPHHQNLPEIEKALQEAGNGDVTLRMLPGLNHLFQRAETGTVDEYIRIEETMAPEVLELIREWITARFVSG